MRRREGIDLPVKTKRLKHVCEFQITQILGQQILTKYVGNVYISVQFCGLDLFVSLLHSPVFLPFFWNFHTLRRRGSKIERYENEIKRSNTIII